MSLPSRHYIIWVGLIWPLCVAVNAWGENTHNDYTSLIELIHIEDKTAPLLALNDFETKTDTEDQAGFMKYFDQHPEIVKQIQNSLGEKAIRWRLKKIQHRLLFVPELRKEYAGAFESYCMEVIDYLLDQTQLENPYHAIRTLQKEFPEPAENGVTVFLVHNLAQESIADFIFLNSRKKKVEIQLKGMKYIGEVGS